LEGGPNTYGYVNGNPINWSDPRGLKGFWRGTRGTKETLKALDEADAARQLLEKLENFVSLNEEKKMEAIREAYNQLDKRYKYLEYEKKKKVECDAKVQRDFNNNKCNEDEFIKLLEECLKIYQNNRDYHLRQIEIFEDVLRNNGRLPPYRDPSKY